MTDSKRNRQLLFAALALFFFVFLEATLFFQTCMSNLSGPGDTLQQLPIQGASTLGLLTFPLANRLVPDNRRIPFLTGTAVLGIVSLVGVAGGPTPYSIVAAGTVSFLLIGLAGGAVYWATCVQSRSIARFATFIGASHALAMVAQIPLYSLTLNETFEAVILSVGIVALTVLIAKTWPSRQALQEMKAYRSTRADKRIEEKPAVGWRLSHMTATISLVLIFALILLFALLFNTLYNLTAHDFTTWTSQYTEIMPRLVMAAGGLLAGILFDIKRGRYLGITMFWISLFAAAAVLGMQEGLPNALGEVAYFFGSGAFMTFYTATFIWVAPHLRVPDFWTGMGRALNNLTAIAVGAPSLLVIQSSSPVAVTATLLPLLVAINALLFAVGMMELRPGRKTAAEGAAPKAAEGAAGSPAASGEAAASDLDGPEASTEGANRAAACSSTQEPPATGEAESSDPPPSDRLQAFTERYGLTPRESEVIAAVAADDRPLKQVAADMGISLRVLQRHLTSLYHKTETQTRVSLTVLYWK